MKFADWLRGVATVAVSDLTNVFNDAKAFITASPLPANIKADLNQTLTDAQGDLVSIGGLAGSVVGGMAADAVDDLTSLLMNTAQTLTSAKSPAQFSAAEKTVLAQTWTAMRAQGDTLVSQLVAGINPAAPALKPAAPFVQLDTVAVGQSAQTSPALKTLNLG